MPHYYYFLGTGIVLSTIGAWWAAAMLRLLRSGRSVEGFVSRVRRERSGDGDFDVGSVTFRDASGQPQTAKDAIKAEHVLLGQPVSILYEAKRPTRAVQDAGLRLLLGPAILTAIGLACIVAAAYGWK